jgi:phosphoglycolate phosphatase-like HAD superfamily hydrolase
MLNLFEFHQASYAQMFQDIFGIPASIRDIAFSGKTTPNILREVCSKHGLANDFVEERLALACDYITEASRHKLIALGDGIQQYILPGVRALLNELQAVGLTLGVLSGNPPALGHFVLEQAQLHTYFRLFTFGTEAESRSELARLSLNKLRAFVDPRLIPEQVVIIGDSVIDVQAALEVGALSLAVATGFHSRDELAACNPHWLFADLTDTDRLVATLKGIERG